MAIVRDPLHQQVSRAVDRAARAQDESHALIDECRQLSDELHATVSAARFLRDARATARRLRAERTFGNGQVDARMPSGPG